MISLALPWVFGAAVLAAVGVAALHLLSVRQPPELLLPTARFLPEREIRAVSRTRRPSDLLLLCMRIALFLCVGLAAAGPSWRSSSRTRAALLVVSPAIASDSTALRALVSAGDSGAVVTLAFADSSGVRASHAFDDEPAALFPLAWRSVGQVLSRDATIDSVDLHLALSTPAPDASARASWQSWRAVWPGRVVLHTPPPITATVSRGTMVLAGDTVGARANTDDVIRAAMAWHAARRAATPRADTVVLMRGDGAAPTSGAVQVVWPVTGVPAGWTRVASATDSALALASGGLAIVGPWRVTAEPRKAEPRMEVTRALAWWSGGRVAATERVVNATCVREVAAIARGASDVLLSPAANALFDALLAPCAPPVRQMPASLSVRTVDGTALASTSALSALARAHGQDVTRGGASRLVQTLLVLSLLLLGLEWWWRTRAPRVAA